MALQLSNNGALYIDPSPETSIDTFTIAMWVKLTSLVQYQSPFQNGHGGGFGQGYNFLVSDEGKLAVDVALKNYHETTTYDIADGNWHWIAMQKVSGGNWKFFLDSVTSEDVGTTAPFSISTDSMIVIGGYNENGSVVHQFHGHIAELGYWTSILNSTQLGQLLAQSLPSAVGTPYIYLPFSDDANFGENQGSGGDFSISGTLTESAHPFGGAPAFDPKKAAGFLNFF